jgi:predicted phosphohydrolase
MVSDSQGPRENWDHWKTRCGTKVRAILPEMIFFSSEIFKVMSETSKSITGDEWEAKVVEQERLSVSKCRRIDRNCRKLCMNYSF